MKEIWKDIEGFEGLYKVSNKGRVRSFHKSGRIMKPDTTNHGHLRVWLCKNGNKKRYLIHRLVARAFIPNPENKPQINHIDADPSNNHVSNLQWSTQSENISHAYEIGNKNRQGENHQTNKLTKNDVLDIRNAYKLGCFLQREIAEAYGVGQDLISKIVNRKIWSHI
jgi:predicted XRE-type DNA-binding protein